MILNRFCTSGRHWRLDKLSSIRDNAEKKVNGSLHSLTVRLVVWEIEDPAIYAAQKGKNQMQSSPFGIEHQK